jgi:hypothetical protein
MHPVEHQILQTRREFLTTSANGIGASVTRWTCGRARDQRVDRLTASNQISRP